MTTLRAWTVCGAALAVLTVSCRRDAATDATASNVATVAVQTVKPTTFRDLVTGQGTMVPSAIGDLTVYAPEAATIVDLPVKENDVVKAGDLLVKFDIPSVTDDLAVKTRAVVNATSRLDAAKATVDQKTQLFAGGYIARVEVDASKTAALTASSDLDLAKADLANATALGARAMVTARFSGTVVKVWHAVGDHVTAAESDQILRVVDTTHLQASAQIPVGELAQVAQGQPATVRAVTGDATATGVVVLPRVPDPNAPTRDVRVAFLETPPVPMDTPVTIEIVLGQRPNALMVPSAAVQKDETGNYVMMAGDDGRAHRRDVRTGVQSKDLTELASGVSPGERVITAGFADLSDNAPIAVADTPSAN